MSSRAEFATPKALCRSAFDRLRPGLIFPAGIDEALYAAFEEGHRTGDPRLQVKLIREVVGDSDWEWPWMLKCAEEFHQLGIWPAQWQMRKIENPLRWNDIPPDVKLDLLSVTLSQFAFIAHTFVQSTHPDVRSVYKLTLIASRPCQVSAYLVNRFKNAVESGDFTKMPPYFPNDMVTLTTTRRIPRGSVTTANSKGSK